MQKYNTITPSNVYKFGTQFKPNKLFSRNAAKAESVFFKIIVPNYNNMSYIKKCLDSILQQSIQDFKIIIVDDMSTDMSDKFCQSYARKYPSKITFLSTNKKLYAGGARNIGLKYQINCKYVLFVDSDDWLFNNKILENLKLSIEKAKYPLFIRMPLYHYYGDGSSLNRIDTIIKPDKITIFMYGPGPGRVCISSQLQHIKFIENRSKRNDVIWFLRCIDQIENNQLLSLNYPCQTYNRISLTSCQNNIDMRLSKKCIEDETINHVADLLKENFKTKECKYLAQFEIDLVSKFYKPAISVKRLLKYSYVISVNPVQLKRFYEIFLHFQLKYLPQHFNGCTDQKLTIAERIKQSHIEVVKLAKKNNLPYICIFEDDAYPQKDIVKQLENYLRAIPKNAMMVVLGWISGYEPHQLRPFSNITSYTISGAHSYILFKEGYDRWLYLMKYAKPPHKQFNIYPPDNFVFNDMRQAYIVNYPLFIQYNQNKSIHRHIGFVFNGYSTTPPLKFEKYEQMKISIIIPTYNMEKYLSKCLDSICAQTYKNIEIICIDDCSTDNTYKMLLEYQKTDSRIQVLKNSKNSMVGYSRNVGLKKATGDYILFVDPDDYCETTLVEKSLNQMLKTESDCCIFNFDKFDSSSGKIYSMPQILNLKNIDLSREWISSTTDNVFEITTSCPMKMWSSNLIKNYNIKFIEGAFGEDSLFTYSGLYYANRITFIKEPLYHYRFNQKTNQTSNLDKRPLDGILTTSTLLNSLHIDNLTTYEQFILSLIKRLKWIYSCLTNNTKPLFLQKLKDEQLFEHLIYKKEILTKSYFLSFKKYFNTEFNKFNII